MQGRLKVTDGLLQTALLRRNPALHRPDRVAHHDPVAQPALAQHDIKKLLAYHSVENIGIILLGVGLGVFFNGIGMGAVAALGFGPGLTMEGAVLSRP